MHEAERIASVLECARAQAAATGVATEVVFDVVNRTYKFDSSTFSLPKQVHFGVKKGLKGPPAKPSKAIKKPITFANNRATFSDSGISSAGTIYLIDTINQQQVAISCAVGQYTRVRIYMHKDKWYELTT